MNLEISNGVNILSIETSCDETAAAIIEANKGNLSVVSNVVSSQVKLHAKWGGVVPNLAAREHVKNIIPVIDETFEKAKMKPDDIDLIAVTQGPGLIPALLVGTNAAKTLAYLWKKPLIGIHHIEGHIYANFVQDKISEISNSKFLISKQIPNSKKQKLKTEDPSIKFPLLALVVSGGHTQLVLMKKHLQYEIVGQTLDDAAGEAFDKVARILDLGYPGGPAIAAESAKFENSNLKIGGKSKLRITNYELQFPRPLINSKDFNFSFSGLKTAVLYKVKKIPKSQLSALKSQICHEFQQAVIDVLVSKTLKAAQKYNPQTIVLAGGVSANKELREQLGKNIKKELPNTKYYIPDTIYSLDNAAMIASAAYFRWKNINASQRKKLNTNWKNLEANAGLKLG